MWDIYATIAIFSWLVGIICGMGGMVWIRAGRHLKVQSKIILLNEELQ